jgi:hypothetical protein
MEARRNVFEAQEREKCAKKRKYLDKASAEGHAEKYFLQGGVRMPKNVLVPYHCPWCRNWHLKTERNT